MDFKDLITLEKQEVASTTEEARFSFIKGVYVEDNCPQGTSYADGSIYLPLFAQVLSFNSPVVGSLIILFHFFSNRLPPQKMRSNQKRLSHWLR